MWYDNNDYNKRVEYATSFLLSLIIGATTDGATCRECARSREDERSGVRRSGNSGDNGMVCPEVPLTKVHGEDGLAGLTDKYDR